MGEEKRTFFPRWKEISATVNTDANWAFLCDCLGQFIDPQYVRNANDSYYFYQAPDKSSSSFRKKIFFNNPTPFQQIKFTQQE